MGRAIMQAIEKSGIKGVVVFVTRQYGGNKIGYKRFQIVKDLTSKVIPQCAVIDDTANLTNPATPWAADHDMPLKALTLGKKL